MYKLLLKRSSEKSLARMDVRQKKRVIRALDELVEKGIMASNVKKLQDPLHGYRKRVGDHRILFDCDGNYLVVHLIGKRSQIYK